MKTVRFLMLISAGVLLIMVGFGFAQLKGVSSPTAKAETITRPEENKPAAASAFQAPTFADIVEKAYPAVVAVSTISTPSENRNYTNEEEFFFNPFEFFFGPNRQMPKGQKQYRQSGGSGFIVSSDGYILTNNHVVEEADKVTVTLNDDREFSAKVVGRDEETDVALIKIEASSLPVLPLGDSESLRPGDWVMAIGNPLMYRNTVTVGVVSAKGRRLSKSALDDFIQTDAAINFGNSGGPLINVRGEVVGINTAITRSDPMGRVVEGIGFAIPVNVIKEQMDQLKTSGKVSRGYLGIRVGAVDADAKEYYKSKHGIELKSGVLVQSVDKGTPAMKAGIQKGDIIVSIEGKEIKDSKELVHKVASYAPKKTIKIDLYRDGKKKRFDVTLADRKEGIKNGSAEEEEDELDEKHAKLGISVEELNQRNRAFYRIPGDINGVLIKSVDPKSNAFSKNLRSGLVISEVNGEAIESLSEYKSAVSKIKSGDVVSLYIEDETGGSYIYFKAE